MRAKDKPKEEPKLQYQICCAECRVTGVTFYNMRSLAKKSGYKDYKLVPDVLYCKRCMIQKINSLSTPPLEKSEDTVGGN